MTTLTLTTSEDNNNIASDQEGNPDSYKDPGNKERRSE